MKILKMLMVSAMTLAFIAACSSTPPMPKDNSESAARAKAASDASHQEMERGFDPCKVNSKLAVCNE